MTVPAAIPPHLSVLMFHTLQLLPRYYIVHKASPLPAILSCILTAVFLHVYPGSVLLRPKRNLLFSHHLTPGKCSPAPHAPVLCYYYHIIQLRVLLKMQILCFLVLSHPFFSPAAIVSLLYDSIRKCVIFHPHFDQSVNSYNTA